MAYTKPQGWSESPFWETYAANFANDGSDEQLAAAMSKSVPDSWLKDYKTPFSEESDAFRRSAEYGSGIAFQDARARGANPDQAAAKVRGVQDRSSLLNRYSQALQKRIKDDFEQNRKSYFDRGTAGLRGQSEQALNDDFAGIDESANSRGLLYSGKRQSARTGAAAARSNELRNAVSNYEKQLSDTSRHLADADFSSDINSLLQQQDYNSIASGAFYQKLRDDATQAQQMIEGAGSVGQGLGSLGGTATAKKK